MPPKNQKAAASPAKTEEKKTEQPKQEAKPAAAAPAPAKTEEKKAEPAKQDAKPAAAAAPAAAKKDEKKPAETKKDDKKAAPAAAAPAPAKTEEKKAEPAKKQDAKPAAAAAPAKKEEKKPEPKKEEPAKVEAEEDGDEEEDGDDDEMPSLEGQQQKGTKKPKANRGEQKNRKALSKLGFKPVAGVTKVTIKMRGTLISIDVPEVSQSPAKDAFLVFGAPQVQDPNKEQAKLMQALQAMAPGAAGANQGAPAAAAATSTDAAKPADKSAAEAAVDESGIDAKDIELVMSQANCTRAKAVEALRKNNKDVVNSIMQLMS